MGGIDLTTALARLLTDEALRRRFESDPGTVARLLGLQERDLTAFLAIDPHDLARQADSLLEKRRHEVARLLPRTFARLDAEDEDAFVEYARCHWPSSHARHLEDAAEFGRFLIARRYAALNRTEFNRVRFLHERRRLRVHWLNNTMTADGLRSSLQILFRFYDEKPNQILTYFAF